MNPKTKHLPGLASAETFVKALVAALGSKVRNENFDFLYTEQFV